jgi:zinc D-Ala-D-Ala dipeptidase
VVRLAAPAISLGRVRRALVLALVPLAMTPAAASAKAAPAFPDARHLAQARHYIAKRRCICSFAVIDTRGRLRGFVPHRVYVSASVVKAMLLVSYLRKLGHRAPNAAERAALGPMIRKSDNRSATAVYRRVGDAALRGLAQRAGMRRFSIAGFWANAHFSAEDQARFMRRFDRLVPRRNRAYARGLLASVVRRQRWGFSRFSLRHGWATFFKGGWRRTGRGQLVHEVAMFQRGRRRFSLAVLTDGNPTQAYGRRTLRGVAKRLFRTPTASAAASKPRLAKAGLRDLQRLSPTLQVDLRYGTKRNFTGKPLPGYCRPWALMLRPAARDLAAVQRDLRRRGLGLKVFDAYRPARASRAMVRWARDHGRRGLVGTYIAARSRHNLGSALDLTLVRLRDGSQPPMGTRYDHLGPAANTMNAHGRALRNRLILKHAMERHGFANYRREWWHYEHRVRGSRYLDLTLGC